MATEEAAATESEETSTGEAGDEQNTGGGDTAASETTSDTVITGGEGADKDAADTGGDASGEGGDEDGAGKEGEGTVPENYADFNLPEGLSISDEYLQEIAPVFKELGLTQEQAQKVIDVHTQRAQAGEEARSEAFNQVKQEWLDAAKADKEIGGEAFDENVASAQLALKQFGSDGLKQVLRDYGIGNHPEVIRVFTKVGKLLKEDQPGVAGGTFNGKPDRAEILYGN